ncbi:MAG: SUMF1/EgtB/PvdO family nonheme iron enzyme [Phycisphaeraceae bacterium]|nr:SUMF1/EgtB/PvdO family nonheme iron enzyme [Phycisphaeraceae bacterium]
MISQKDRYLNRGGVTLASLALFAPCAVAQVDPSGIDFVTITHAGNAPYQSIFPSDFVNGRGGVDYEYRLGKFEVTTAQWVEFFNAAYDRSDGFFPHLRPPGHWGATATTPNTPGGLRWAVPAGNEMMPVGNISWRMAAMYCNWLHNDKSTDRSAFMNGAYDVSTFGFNGGIFTDQLARHPEARYWIPTWDEWLKAAHYDPNKLNGDGTTGGWWQYSNGSDTPYVYGPPGVGQANAGFTTPSPFAIPLGSYATTSPWGLYDMAGGTTEWTESVRTISTGQIYRVFDGSWWSREAFGSSLGDQIRYAGAEFPHIPTYEFGLRVASIVPAASTCAPAGVLLLLGARRRRPCVDSSSVWLRRSGCSALLPGSARVV